MAVYKIHIEDIIITKLLNEMTMSELLVILEEYLFTTSMNKGGKGGKIWYEGECVAEFRVKHHKS
jgi:hypothetical protein